jgi:transcriptional regulator with XRE-family HTH domain
LAYCRQQLRISLLMANRRKQIQPRAGVERAFGEVMRTMREDLGMSQMKFHVKTGLDRTFISDLERGVQCPSLRTIYRVAAGLDIPPGNLVRRTAQSPYFVFPSEEG